MSTTPYLVLQIWNKRLHHLRVTTPNSLKSPISPPDLLLHQTVLPISQLGSQLIFLTPRKT